MLTVAAIASRVRCAVTDCLCIRNALTQAGRVQRPVLFVFACRIAVEQCTPTPIGRLCVYTYVACEQVNSFENLLLLPSLFLHEPTNAYRYIPSRFSQDRKLRTVRLSSIGLLYDSNTLWQYS